MAEETLPAQPGVDDEFEGQGAQLTIFEHLDELRGRLMSIGIAMLICTGIGLVLAPRIFDLLISRGGAEFEPVAIEMTETFVTYFKVSIMTGAGIASGFIVYQIVQFVNPGLTNREKHVLRMVLPLSAFFFIGGVAFGFFITLPFAIKYLLFTFPDVVGLDIRQDIRISNYVSFVTTVLFAMGMSFQTPLIVFTLVKLHVVSRRALQKFRKYAILVAFVVAAIVTPTPDPLNQSLVAIPLIVLYELGIQISRFGGDFGGNK